MTRIAQQLVAIAVAAALTFSSLTLIVAVPPGAALIDSSQAVHLL